MRPRWTRGNSHGRHNRAGRASLELDGLACDDTDHHIGDDDVRGLSGAVVRVGGATT